MKKIIAKTISGAEYIYSKLETYQVSNKSADIICQSMNRAKYNLKNNEIWHIYTVSDYTYKNMTMFRAIINHGKIKFYEIWRAI